MSATRQAADTRRGSLSYRGLWLALPRELAFLVSNLVIAVAGSVVVGVLVGAGAALVTVLIGAAVIVGALVVARALARSEAGRIAWAGAAPFELPATPVTRGEDGPFARLVAPVTDGHAWFALLHVLVVAPVLAVGTSLVVGLWAAAIVVGVHNVVAALTGAPTIVPEWPGSPGADPAFGPLVVGLVSAGLALVTAGTLPFVTRGALVVHRAVARALVGRWRSEDMAEELARVTASRGAAAEAEDRSLRRLERDIHDGPQQRLVRLQMDLAAIERRIETDPDGARAIAIEARGLAKEALDELRALARGFAPPILQDRGFADALRSLVGTSPVRTILDGSVPPLPPVLERTAYFVAAELLANVGKHSSASEARVAISLRSDPSPSVVWLDLWVTDDGSGGATARPGGGLSGLVDRVGGLGGVLRIDSPPGGPTVIGCHLPIDRDDLETAAREGRGRTLGE